MNSNSRVSTTIAAATATTATTSRAAQADATTKELAARASRPEARASLPEARPSGGRWWFAFDRWLAVADVGSPDDDFVLA